MDTIQIPATSVLFYIFLLKKRRQSCIVDLSSRVELFRNTTVPCSELWIWSGQRYFGLLTSFVVLQITRYVLFLALGCWVASSDAAGMFSFKDSDIFEPQSRAGAADTKSVAVLTRSSEKARKTHLKKRERYIWVGVQSVTGRPLEHHKVEVVHWIRSRGIWYLPPARRCYTRTGRP